MEAESGAVIGSEKLSCADRWCFTILSVCKRNTVKTVRRATVISVIIIVVSQTIVLSAATSALAPALLLAVESIRIAPVAEVDERATGAHAWIEVEAIEANARVCAAVQLLPAVEAE